MESLQKYDIRKISIFLEEHDIRPSQKRIMLMYYLMKYRNHPTIDDMFLALHDFIPTLSKTTVYNTMDMFVSHGVVKGLSIDEKQMRYDADISPHAHFLCNSCGRLFDVPIKENVISLLKSMSPDDMRTAEISIYYKGICRECKNKY